LPIPGKSGDLTIAQSKGPSVIEAKQETAATKETNAPSGLGETKQDNSPAPANLTLDYAR